MSEIIYYRKPKDRSEKWRLLCYCGCYFRAYQKDITGREKCPNGKVAVACPKCGNLVWFYPNENKVEYTLNKIRKKVK